MSTLPTTVPVVEVAPDVLPHVRAHGVEGVYRHVLESVPRLFPTFRSLRVTVEPDVAIEDHIFIVFEVRVPIADVPNYLEATSRWSKDLHAGYPYPRQEPFVLDLIREEE